MVQPPKQSAPRGPAEPIQGPAAAPADGAVSEAFATLRKRKWIILACVILGIVYGFYQSATQPISYTAYGRIEVRPTNSSGGANTANLAQDASNLETEVLIITSQSLLLNVAQDMNLANNPAFMGPGPYRDINDPAIRQAVVGNLAGTLAVQVVPHSEIIRIDATTGNAQLTADIVNHVIQAYIQRSFESRFASTQKASQWLSGQLDDLKQQVEAAQERLVDLQKKLGSLGLNFDSNQPPTSQMTNTLAALSGASTTARINRILAESRYRVLESADPNLLESSLAATSGASELTGLRSDAATTRASIAQESISLGPKNPQIIALQAHLREVEREISTEQTRLLTEAKQSLVAAQANEAQTAAALEQQKNESYQLSDQVMEYTLRRRDYETNRALYEELLSRLRSASIQAGLNSMEVDVVDQAYKPVSPTFTPRSSILTRTTLLGVVLGIILAFTLDSLDTGIRSISELEHVTQLPSLSLIPKIKRPTAPEGSVAQSNVFVLSKTTSQFTESFRSLRTSLLLSSTDSPPKVVLITSSTPSEGKTTVSTNLAAVLAQNNVRVLLIDGDLRRPNVHHRFGLDGRVGLSTVLVGATSLEDAIRTIPEAPNLSVLCSGPVPPFPTEMLSSASMRHLLEKCRELYTHIVIDSPPILSVTDGVILARLSDAVALVVRHGKSGRSAVRRACDLLLRAGATTTGVVLNSVDLSSPEYQGYYGYGGYSYSSVDSESWDTASRQSRPEPADPLPSRNGEDA